MLNESERKQIESFIDSYLTNFKHYKSEKKDWCYEDGVILKGAYSLYLVTKEEKYLDFCIRYFDENIHEDGTLNNYTTADHNIDNLQAGTTLFLVNKIHPVAKYQKALDLLVSQLKEAKQDDKLQEVLEEVPRVRKDFGEPPLVTPSSQIVGTQAVLNVLMGERYKMVTKESKDLLSGKYGQTIKPFNAEVQKKAIGDTVPITHRPADDIEPELDKLRKEIEQYSQQDEDVLSYALFPQVATEFFKYRQAQQTGVDMSKADTTNKTYPA